MNYLTLWTIQHPDVWKQICMEGRYVLGDPYFLDENEYCNIPEFVKSYDWMIKKMEEKLGKRPTNCTLPIWAWYRHRDEYYPKPDLRTIVWQYPKNCKRVIIELEIPRNKVLLSDFESWHHVLNNWYLPISAKDSHKFDNEAKKAGVDLYREEHPKNFQDRIEASWDRVFDLNGLSNYTSGPKRNRSIQATLWEIFRINVTTVKEFNGRAPIRKIKRNV